MSQPQAARRDRTGARTGGQAQALPRRIRTVDKRVIIGEAQRMAKPCRVQLTLPDQQHTNVVMFRCNLAKDHDDAWHREKGRVRLGVHVQEYNMIWRDTEGSEVWRTHGQHPNP